MRVSSKWCGRCNMYMRAERRSVHHLVHLVVTVLLCGAWLPVWGLDVLLAACGRWRCGRCGRKL